jgi:hypothetical protein
MGRFELADHEMLRHAGPGSIPWTSGGCNPGGQRPGCRSAPIFLGVCNMRITEILDCISKPASQINAELITRLDLDDPETRINLMELRKLVKKKRLTKQMALF